MAKSQLYEFIQKSDRVSRPKFSYQDEFDIKTNTHSFKCNAIITIDTTCNEYVSNFFANKKDANQNVCLKVYQDLNSTSPNISNVSSAYHPIEIDKIIWILIDYENVSNPKEILKLERFLTVQPFESKVIKFAGHASTVRDTADIIVKSTRKDAVDHYIGFWIGQEIGKDSSIEERKQSLMFRIENEDRFLEKWSSQALLGWTPWYFMDLEEENLICDSLWIIILSCYGLAGWLAWSLLLGLPALVTIANAKTSRCLL